MKKLFFTLIFLSTLSSAFTFDIWESKITLDEAIQIAESNDIPLHKDGSISINKKFDIRFLYLKKYPNNRVFSYSTTLLNKRANVMLYFTKHSKELYSVKIRWGMYTKDFMNTLYQLLDKKYGQKKVVIPSNIGELILYKTRQWQPDKNTLVQNKTSIGTTDLTYYDIEETHKEEEERKKIQIEKKEKALIKDANKF